MTLNPGDILGFSGESLVSDLINLGTYGIPRWGISHVGIMAGATDGRLLLFESTTLDGFPCELTGKRINGVQAHRADAVVANYRGKVWRFPVYRKLYWFERQRLTKYLMGMIGTPYSEIGAVRAAGLGFSWVESLLHKNELHSIFCSELCATALTDIGLMQTTKPGRWSPNHLVGHMRAHGELATPERLK